MVISYNTWTKEKVEEQVATRVKKVRRGKGRSSRTNLNKTKRLKKIYKKLYKRSEKLKATRKKPKKEGFLFFSEKFPTVDSYLKNITLKQVNSK